ncbi:MAG TPA: fibronectin type III domain-containing protein [Rhodocyclaceae bacterium]|nr:fibronectin type III domain-containing protein [Rhodocyclaceae bacterium]
MPQNLVVPPLAFEDTHITVAWDKPVNYSGVSGYHVYVNGVLKGTTSKISWADGITNQQLYYDVTGLTAGTSYTLTVRSYDSGGVESADSNAVVQATTATPATINVTSSPYNAVGNGSTLNTVAIQNAINACATGGKVLIPSGTFKTGALYLKSNCTYEIDGTLLGSDSASDYEYGNDRFPLYGTSGFGSVTYPQNYKSLINTCGHYSDWSARSGYTTDNLCTGMQNIRITGSGTVQGSSGSSSDSANSGYYITTLAHNERAAQGGDSSTGDPARSDLVSLTGVNGLYIANLHFTLPAEHTLFVARSSNITVANVNVLSFTGGSNGLHNGDGIDLSTSYASSLSSSGPSGLLPTNAYIFGSVWNTGDDCINLNAGTGAPGVAAGTPVNNLHIFNNNTLNGHGGVVFGSFTAAGFKNVAITENTFDGTQIGLRFKTGSNRGGGIATLGSGDFGVMALDNKVNAIIDDAISFDGSYPDSSGFASGGNGYFHDIVITNLTGSVGSSAYVIETAANSGYEDTKLKFTNVNITGGKGISIKGVNGSATDTLFTNVSTSSSTFTYASGLLTSSNFVGCSPSPVAK